MNRPAKHHVSSERENAMSKINCIPPLLTPQQISRFHARIKRGNSSDCWPYQGYSLGGYGHYNYKKGGRSVRAHRLAYYLHYGIWPTVNVLHHCDNPPCCNPCHLFVGTHADNVADKVAKNRQARGSCHGSVSHPEKTRRGEMHPMAKLTATMVAYIKGMLRGIPGEQTEIARRTGISNYTVHLIAKNKIWKNVLPARFEDIPAPLSNPIHPYHRGRPKRKH